MKFRICLALSVLMPLALPASPALGGGLDLNEARELALERDEELAALRAEARGAREQAVADGALPDPEVGIGYMNLPVDSFATGEDGMTQLQFTARQKFPAGRSRQLSTDIGETLAEARDEEARARRREVIRETTEAWLRWSYAARKLEIAESAEATFEEFVEITRSRYATGTGTQRDLSRARLELASLQERVLELELERDDAAARLGRWIGAGAARNADPGEGRVALPDEQRLAREALVDHPRVRAENLRIEAGELNVDRARQRYRPEWMVEVGYSHRRAEDAAGDRASDLVSGMVGLSVPLFTRNRQDRQVAAARESATAAAHRRGDTLNDLHGRLERELAAHERYRELTELYEENLLNEAARNVALKFDAYRVDREDFLELVRARVDQLDFRLRLLRIERDQALTRTQLHYLVGETS